MVILTSNHGAAVDSREPLGFGGSGGARFNPAQVERQTTATELIQTDGPTLLNGWDTLTFAALAAGVRAVVWGAASIVPEPCVELHRLLIDDIDLPAARELWSRLWPLCRFRPLRHLRGFAERGIPTRHGSGALVPLSDQFSRLDPCRRPRRGGDDKDH